MGTRTKLLPSATGYGHRPRKGHRREWNTHLSHYMDLHGHGVGYLAAYLHVSPSAISHAKFSHHNLSGDNWDRLADLYGVDPRVLKGKKPIV